MTADQVPQETTLGRYAGFVTRLIAWIIDQLIVSAVISVTFIVARFVSDTLSINELLNLGDAAQTVMTIIAGVLVLLFVVSYNIVFWMLAGQTPGKRAMGVRVVRSNGERLDFGASVRRQLGLVVSAILFLGYLWVLVDNRRQGFHDKIAGTFVVYAWPETLPYQGKPVRDRIRKIQSKDQVSQGTG